MVVGSPCTDQTGEWLESGWVFYGGEGDRELVGVDH